MTIWYDTPDGKVQGHKKFRKKHWKRLAKIKRKLSISKNNYQKIIESDKINTEKINGRWWIKKKDIPQIKELVFDY